MDEGAVGDSGGGDVVEITGGFAFTTDTGIRAADTPSESTTAPIRAAPPRAIDPRRRLNSVAIGSGRAPAVAATAGTPATPAPASSSSASAACAGGAESAPAA